MLVCGDEALGCNKSKLGIGLRELNIGVVEAGLERDVQGRATQGED